MAAVLDLHRCRHCGVWQQPSQTLMPDINGSLCVTCVENAKPRFPARPGVVVQFQPKVQHG